MVNQGNGDQKNANKGDANSNEEEWDFSAVTLPKFKPEEKPDLKTKDSKVVPRKKQQLSLDESNLRKMKTRSEMAASLMKANEEEEEQEEQDSFVLASYPKRGIAFVLDMVFLAIITAVVVYSAPIVRMLVQMFLDRYKLQFTLPESIVMDIILAINAFIALMVCIVIPVAFYGHSLGKKFLGLKIRSIETPRVSLSQAWQRELIYKPLGILIVVGFFIPFFTRKKQALHDLLAETLVIED